MSYQVLARKWRPRSFATMVGQTHVLQALINALDNDRLHHAYLFTGTRGVGKTTVARIFAKSLNCEAGVSSTPCGECSACREINEGRFIDLIEVDAASRTRVEDTRELLDNVQYVPTRGRFKVYLIDEVHMLSTHSFNALLKTLEEPPPHVKFLLATTDPQKLPPTVLSRCLQFNLKRLSPELIAGHLAYLLKEEKIENEVGAITQLSEAADGSMRDGLSLLDQAIAFGGGRLTTAEVSTMLGSIDRRYIFDLLTALAAADAQGLLDVVHALSEQGADFSAVLKALNAQLHQLALAQIAPAAVANHSDSARLMALAQDISPEDVQLYYQMGINGSRDLPFAPELRAGFEMIVLRMLAFRPLDLSMLATDTPVVSTPQPAARGARPQALAQPQDKTPTLAECAPSPPPVSANAGAVAGQGSWRDIVEQLGLGGMAYQLAINSVMIEHEGDVLSLSLASQHATLRSAAMEKRLQAALSAHFGTEIKLKFSLASADVAVAQETPAVIQQREAHDEHQAAVAAMKADANVQKICTTFDGRVIEESVKPINK